MFFWTHARQTYRGKILIDKNRSCLNEKTNVISSYKIYGKSGQSPNHLDYHYMESSNAQTKTRCLHSSKWNTNHWLKVSFNVWKQMVDWFQNTHSWRAYFEHHIHTVRLLQYSGWDIKGQSVPTHADSQVLFTASRRKKWILLMNACNRCLFSGFIYAGIRVHSLFVLLHRAKRSLSPHYP